MYPSSPLHGPHGLSVPVISPPPPCSPLAFSHTIITNNLATLPCRSHHSSRRPCRRPRSPTLGLPFKQTRGNRIVTKQKCAKSNLKARPLLSNCRPAVSWGAPHRVRCPPHRRMCSADARHASLVLLAAARSLCGRLHSGEGGCSWLIRVLLVPLHLCGILRTHLCVRFHTC